MEKYKDLKSFAQTASIKNINSDYLKQMIWVHTEEILSLISDLEVAVKALCKLRDGPGNSMVGWGYSWTHDYAVKALSKIQGTGEEK